MGHNFGKVGSEKNVGDSFKLSKMLIDMSKKKKLIKFKSDTNKCLNA